MDISLVPGSSLGVRVDTPLDPVSVGDMPQVTNTAFHLSWKL